jgi:hypothetical protein
MLQRTQRSLRTGAPNKFVYRIDQRVQAAISVNPCFRAPAKGSVCADPRFAAALGFFAVSTERHCYMHQDVAQCRDMSWNSVPGMFAAA